MVASGKNGVKRACKVYKSLEELLGAYNFSKILACMCLSEYVTIISTKRYSKPKTYQYRNLLQLLKTLCVNAKGNLHFEGFPNG